MSTEVEVNVSAGCRIATFRNDAFGAEAYCTFCGWKSARYGGELRAPTLSLAQLDAHHHADECTKRPTETT